MIPNTSFEVLRRQPQLNASGAFTSAYLAASGVAAVVGTESAPRGLALGAHATQSESLDLAGPNSFLGHLTRRVIVGGASLADRIFGVTSPVPVGVEFGFADGLEVSVEKAEEIEAEGASYLLLTGTGLISAGTAIGTPLSFKNGLLYVAQAGDTAFYNLTANSLPSSDGVSLRIRAVKI